MSSLASKLSTGLFKLFTEARENRGKAKIIAQDPLENFHLSFLKWTLGVNKTTSNAAVWGDCGRYPLGVELSKMVFSYRDRLEQMDDDNSPCLARHAYREQRDQKMSWYSHLDAVQRRLEQEASRRLPRPSQIRSAMRNWFVGVWNADRITNRKLRFYNTIKLEFAEEDYLRLDLKNDDFKRIAQIRTSSHKFCVETGRHGIKRLKLVNRVCKHCTTENQEVFDLLMELPYPDPIIEDETHILQTCPLYEDLRQRLLPHTSNLIHSDIAQIFRHARTIRDIGRFLTKVNDRRFPKILPNK